MILYDIRNYNRKKIRNIGLVDKMFYSLENVRLGSDCSSTVTVPVSVRGLAPCQYFKLISCERWCLFFLLLTYKL